MSEVSQKTYHYKYPRPTVSVDAIVFRKNEQNEIQLLLIERGNPPFKGQWAFPGGFVDMDEDLPAAAARELAEETALSNVTLYQLRAFGKPGRDPRGRNISVVYWGIVPLAESEVTSGDDAAAADWFSIEKLPPLAFDHSEIIEFALKTVDISG